MRKKVTYLSSVMQDFQYEVLKGIPYGMTKGRFLLFLSFWLSLSCRVNPSETLAEKEKPRHLALLFLSFRRCGSPESCFFCPCSCLCLCFCVSFCPYLFLYLNFILYSYVSFPCFFLMRIFRICQSRFPLKIATCLTTEGRSLAI